MRLLVDTHTHTVFSGHAFSSVYENLSVAKKRGLQGFVVAEHCRDMEGIIYPRCLTYQKQLPKEFDGVRIFRGIEANIINYRGTIDLEERFRNIPEFVIASLHDVVMKPGSKRENTEAVLGALNDPYVDIIGHPGNPRFEIDQPAVVQEAKKLGKMLEVNAHSFSARPGSGPNCKKIVELCKEHEVGICVSTDAHICFSVGEFSEAVSLLEECAFPEELVASRTLEAFCGYLKQREARIQKINLKEGGRK